MIYSSDYTSYSTDSAYGAVSNSAIKNNTRDILQLICGIAGTILFVAIPLVTVKYIIPTFGIATGITCAFIGCLAISILFSSSGKWGF